MGCGNTKEKLEDEIMKAKLEKMKIQYERQSQMKLLKNLDGTDYKPMVIPDYTAPTKIQKPTIMKSRKTLNLSNSKTIRISPKRNKSFAIKRKTKINLDDFSSKTKKTTKLKNKKLKL